MLFICYPQCSTCQKARKWLDDYQIAYEFRDIKTEHPTAAELKEWQKKSRLPLKRFFNTSGQLYRDLKLKDRLSALSQEEQLIMLASDGMLVKRPLLITEKHVLVGFDPIEWEDKLIGGC
ncbi:MAG: arsenate reductase family protein [Erysipelotrichaceae bacterium]|nr:arsenate reductase family protein [Erysipelotrichaceae bacterium]